MLMNSELLAAASSRLAPAPGPTSRKLGPIAMLLHMWTERRRSRADLAQLDMRLLRDIGLTPRDAIAEAAIPFWKK